MRGIGLAIAGGLLGLLAGLWLWGQASWRMAPVGDGTGPFGFYPIPVLAWIPEWAMVALPALLGILVGLVVALLQSRYRARKEAPGAAEGP